MPKMMKNTSGSNGKNVIMYVKMVSHTTIPPCPTQKKRPFSFHKLCVEFERRIFQITTPDPVRKNSPTFPDIKGHCESTHCKGEENEHKKRRMLSKRQDWPSFPLAEHTGSKIYPSLPLKYSDLCNGALQAIF